MKTVVTGFLFSLLAASFDPGGLEYEQEYFKLVISDNGSGELSVLYKDMGSKEQRTTLRRKDLDILRDIAMSAKVIDVAMEEGVVIVDRRLDFENFRMSAFVKAKSHAYGKIFNVFTHYKLEIQDKIYITPLNGRVKHAQLSDGGEIVVRNNKYSFSWPTSVKELAFTAQYRTEGASFNRELAPK